MRPQSTALTVQASQPVRALPVTHSPPLVQSKLRPPTLRPGSVRRSRVVDLVRDHADRRIVSAIAAPGYGKTTFLAEVAATAARRRELVAWVTLDDLDNDPAILLAYLAAAFDPLLRPVASQRGALAGLVTPVADRAVARLAARLQGLDKPTLLVLDDVHRLADQTALDVIAGLIDRMPSGLTVALAGRTEPHLPFARFRAQGNLLQIRPEDLALDAQEAAAMARAAGFELTSEELERLMRHTEGWPAAISLAIHTAVDEGGAVESLVGIRGSQSYVADYLSSELEHQLSEADMLVLTRTAVLESVPRGIADVLAGPGSGERLWKLSKDHGLPAHQSRANREVRYHPLLKDFLAAELERREAGTATHLHRSAAAWYGKTGQHARAVEESIATGDARLAGAAVTAGAPDE
jgi:LuxR family transcriptional regulator, maltose regulon positive regulatory protein